MNLHNNMQHILHFADLTHGFEYIIVYASQLRGVKRPVALFKGLLLAQGFRRDKLITPGAHLDFLVGFFPTFLQNNNPKVRKANLETFASLFLVFSRSLAAGAQEPVIPNVTLEPFEVLFTYEGADSGPDWPFLVDFDSA